MYDLESIIQHPDLIEFRAKEPEVQKPSYGHFDEINTSTE